MDPDQTALYAPSDLGPHCSHLVAKIFFSALKGLIEFCHVIYRTRTPDRRVILSNTVVMSKYFIHVHVIIIVLWKIGIEGI